MDHVISKDNLGLIFLSKHIFYLNYLDVVASDRLIIGTGKQSVLVH